VNLADVLREAARELADIDATEDAAAAVAWSRAGRLFATLSADGTAAEFALDPAIAAAAARTPDVTPSERAPGWVRFRPSIADEHALDRAEAWFESAHRRAGQR
jgi:hypothetical protein